MKSLFTISLFCLASLLASATQRTVNNNGNLPGNPGQYTDIQSAMNASTSGDTILVAGSPFNYSTTLTVTKKIVLLGPGYNPVKQNPLRAIITGSITLNANNASGFVFMGFVMTNSMTFANGANISGAIVRRNQITSTIYVSDSTPNLTIAENSFYPGGGVEVNTSKNQLNLVITNNMFTIGNSYPIEMGFSMPSNYSPIKVVHNLFMNGNSTTPLINSGWSSFLYNPYGITYNMIVENNIFYNISPGPGNGQVLTNLTFDNNITYAGGSIVTLPPTGSVGSGNINNTDPQMVSLFNATSDTTLEYTLDNIRLQSGSPGVNAGTDGSNIGPTGGLYPVYVSTNQYLTGEPVIPEVKTAAFVGASSTAPGGTLQIQVKAQKID